MFTYPLLIFNGHRSDQSVYVQVGAEGAAGAFGDQADRTRLKERLNAAVNREQRKHVRARSNGQARYSVAGSTRARAEHGTGIGHLAASSTPPLIRRSLASARHGMCICNAVARKTDPRAFNVPFSPAEA